MFLHLERGFRMNVYKFPFRPRSDCGYIIKCISSSEWHYVHNVYSSMVQVQAVVNRLLRGYHIIPNDYRPSYVFVYKIVDKFKFSLYATQNRSLLFLVRLSDMSNLEYKKMIKDLAGNYIEPYQIGDIKI